MANSITKISFRVNGQDIPAPSNWRDVKILSTFDNGNNSSSITTDRWQFVNEAATRISKLFKSGLNGGSGAFEGPNYDIYVSDEEGALQVFEGLLNFSEEYEERNFKGPNFTDPVEVLSKAEMKNSLNAIDSQFSGTTVAFLKSKGVYSDSDYTDVKFVVEKKFDFIEFAVLSFGIFTMVKEAAEAIEKLGSDLSTQLGISGSSATGTIGGTIFRILIIIFRIAYVVLILAQLIIMTERLFNMLISPARTHKGITLDTLLRKGFAYFGYKLVTPITELSSYVYLPTIPQEESNFVDKLLSRVKVTKQGIPSPGDYGYIFEEAVELVLRLFYARIAVVNSPSGREIHIRKEDDEWWFKTSTLDVIDDVLINSITYNADELSRSTYIHFQVDPADSWTTDNYTGTSIEVVTEPKSVNRIENVRIRNLDEVSIPLALGSRKDGLNDLEKFMLSFLGFAEKTVNALGGNKDFTSKLKSRNDMLKVSAPEHGIAKLLYINGGLLPEDHREKLSAEYLYDNGHNAKSFVSNNYTRQRLRFSEVKVPFNFKKFKLLSENPYFITKNGVSGKFEKLEWTIDGDYATASGWIRSIYTKNLKETKIIP